MGNILSPNRPTTATILYNLAAYLNLTETAEYKQDRAYSHSTDEFVNILI